jgi:hypothetical protein
MENGGFPPFSALGTAFVNLVGIPLRSGAAEDTKGAKTMFNFDFRRIATAAVGALILSTVCVGAAVGPATAAPAAVTTTA